MKQKQEITFDGLAAPGGTAAIPDGYAWHFDFTGLQAANVGGDAFAVSASGEMTISSIHPFAFTGAQITDAAGRDEMLHIDAYLHGTLVATFDDMSSEVWHRQRFHQVDELVITAAPGSHLDDLTFKKFGGDGTGPGAEYNAAGHDGHNHHFLF